MRRILRKLKSLLLRTFITFKSILKVIKHGNYSTVNISQINYGSLLKGKNILITGGSTGIGYSIAQKCILEGANVIITGRSEEKLKIAKDSINSQSLKTLVWDISNVKQVQIKIEECKNLFGGDIDNLLNFRT